MSALADGLAAALPLITFAGGLVTGLAGLIIRFRRLEAAETRRRGESRMMLQALFACLDGLKQMGANGQVTGARTRLEEYLIHAKTEE